MNNINIPQKHPYEAKASQKQKKLISGQLVSLFV